MSPSRVIASIPSKDRSQRTADILVLDSDRITADTLRLLFTALLKMQYGDGIGGSRREKNEPLEPFW